MRRTSGPLHVVLLALLAGDISHARASDSIELQVLNLADDPIMLTATSCAENHTMGTDASELVLSLVPPAKFWIVPSATEWGCSTGCKDCFFVEASEPAPGEEPEVKLGWGVGTADTADEDEEETLEHVPGEEVGADTIEQHYSYGEGGSEVAVHLSVFRWRNGTCAARLSIAGSLADAGGFSGDEKDSGERQIWRCRRMCRRQCRRRRRWGCIRRCWRRCRWH
mmetsp:Transcript_121762/g.306377  ORF Transcript_121762/g.306377 Transcript_121762/m.306377 type:complete len:224 (+) Transcript_121762:67-738(+)